MQYDFRTIVHRKLELCNANNTIEFEFLITK